MKTKALVLLSGGLDSLLTAKILLDQGIKVTGLVFCGLFFTPDQAKKMAEQLGIELKIVDFSQEHLAIVIKPKYGYGKGANPCIDCHILMLKMAREIMQKEGFDFVATGEVTGQRPMSQSASKIKLIEKESGLTGYLLRPLCAKNLEPTIPEIKGLVDRDKLLDIAGRSRKRQNQLAIDYDIKDIPPANSGCILTEVKFGDLLRRLRKITKNIKPNDILMLKVGRHEYVNNCLLIISHNKEEGDEILKLTQPGDVLIESLNYPGPLAIVRNFGQEMSNKATDQAQAIIKQRSKKGADKSDFEYKITHC